MAYVIWLDNSFTYDNGEHNPGWLEATGHFDKETGVLSGDIYADDISIIDINVQFFLNHDDKVATIMNLHCNYIDVTSYGDKTIDLHNLKTFHLNSLFISVINDIMRPFLGPKWNTQVYSAHLEEQIKMGIVRQKKQILDVLMDMQLVNNDMCYEIFTHYATDSLKDMLL